MASMSVRGLEHNQLRDLKEEAERQGISLNRLALQRLTGTQDASDGTHHDLDTLIGTWSDQDVNAFASAIAPLEQGDASCVEVLRKADHLQVSCTVVAELLAGFADGNQEARNREELSPFMASARVMFCPNTLQTADSYALIDRDLRRQGKPIPTNDIWIAASCLERGAVLFSFDEHFKQIAGLRVIRSWAEALP